MVMAVVATALICPLTVEKRWRADHDEAVVSAQWHCVLATSHTFAAAF